MLQKVNILLIIEIEPFIHLVIENFIYENKLCWSYISLLPPSNSFHHKPICLLPKVFMFFKKNINFNSPSNPVSAEHMLCQEDGVS